MVNLIMLVMMMMLMMMMMTVMIMMMTLMITVLMTVQSKLHAGERSMVCGNAVDPSLACNLLEHSSPTQT